jgi:hypothetical protein
MFQRRYARISLVFNRLVYNAELQHEPPSVVL